jgi:ubiquinone biosynthesis protein
VPLEFQRTYRNLKRYRQIIGVLVKYGFGEILDRINIASYLKIGRKKLFAKQQELAQFSYAERIRLALEELGPTFVKMGQMMSTRPFLIPVDLVVELTRLQDEVAPFPFEDVKTIIQAELGAPIEELFSAFEPTPMASASLAQVHKATTKDGEQVAVKVQRPNVRQVMENDISILRDLAGLLDRYVSEARQFDPVAIADELWKTTRQEVDFTVEARNLQLFKLNFQNDDRIFLPKIYWDLCSTRVLTLEFIDGIKISDVDKLKSAGIDPEKLIRNGGQLVAEQIFEHGFFHADPHPGNLFALRDNRIAPIDFGMMGRLAPTSIDLINDLLVAASTEDSRRLVRVLQNYDLVGDDAKQRSLEADLTTFLHRFHRLPLSKINMKELMKDTFEIITSYRITLPTELMMLVKALVTYEEVARSIYPEYDFISELEPSIRKLARRKFSPSNLIGDLSRYAVDLRDLVVNFPFELRGIMRRLRQGELSIAFRHRGLEHLILELEKASNRLAFALIIAALIIGSSLIMTRQFGLIVYGIPVLGMIGYITAGFLGIWLAIAILRSGKL